MKTIYADKYRQIGLKIAYYRKLRGLTQEQLAEKVGISSSFMGHIERGTRIASIDTLVSICNVLFAYASL